MTEIMRDVFVGFVLGCAFASLVHAYLDRARRDSTRRFRGLFKAAWAAYQLIKLAGDPHQAAKNFVDRFMADRFQEAASTPASAP